MKKYFLAFLFSIPTLAFAQKIQNPAPGLGSDAWDFIHTIIQILKWIVIPIIAFVIIHSGFKMATAQGDMKKIDEGKKTLLGAIIGLAVLLSADAITNIVRNTGEDLMR